MVQSVMGMCVCVCVFDHHEVSVAKFFHAPLFRTCFFTSESAGCKSRFMTQLNNSFGSGGMTLAFNEAQFAAFVQFIKTVDDIGKYGSTSYIGMDRKKNGGQ